MKPGTGASWMTALSAAVVAISVAGCKEKESLIVATIKADDNNGGSLRSLTLSAGGVSQTFSLPSTGLTMAGTQFGLYVPSDVTGAVNVNATASEPSGCRGYKGEQPVTVPAAGSTVSVTITIRPGTVCAPDGGQGGAGTSGSGGSGGPAGSGGGGTGVGPHPSLQSCTEYLHNDPSNACNVGGVGDTFVWSVAFSPNGQLLVTGGDDGRAVVWNFDGRKPTLAGHVLLGTGHGIVAFSPDGTQLAVGWSGRIDIYSVATWSLSKSLAVSNTIVDLTYTPDGQQIISVDSDQTVGNVYAHSALASGSLLPAFTLALPILPNQVALGTATASGYPVAVALGDGTVGIYALTSTGFQGPSNSLVVSTYTGAWVVRISPNGNVLASGGGDGIVYLWPFPIASTTPSTPNIDVLAAFDADYVGGVAFSPTSDRIAVSVGFFQGLGIWDVAPPRSQLGSYALQSWDMLSIAFSPNGNVVAGGEFDCGVFLVCAD